MLHMVKIHYRNAAGVEGTVTKTAEVAAKVVVEWPKSGYTILGTTEVPWCGWVNSWTDSGDRGAAQADHLRTCDICE